MGWGFGKCCAAKSVLADGNPNAGFDAKAREIIQFRKGLGGSRRPLGHFKSSGCRGAG